MNIIETIAYNGAIIKIVLDENSTNPREYDNLGTMACAIHRRYVLGDTQGVEMPLRGTYISLPLYLYDHSGVAMSTESFIGRAHHAEWDSGQIGYIFATKENIRRWFGVKRVTKKLREKVVKIFVAEVAEYSAYLNGDAYGYIVNDDSCYGFYSIEDAITAAKECV